MAQAKFVTDGELILEGLSASPGIAIGPAYVYQHANIQVSPRKIKKEEIDREVKNFSEVRRRTTTELEKFARFSQVGNLEDTSDIIGAQIEIVNDPDLQQQVVDLIENDQYPADFAICEAFKKYLLLIESSGNKVMIERLVDIQDIRDRMVRRLQQKWHHADLKERAILVSEEFSPMEIIEFTRNNIQAAVSNSGGLTSHATIIANAMGLPMVIGTKSVTRSVRNGDKIIVDGTRGRIIIRPAEKTLTKYRRYLRQIEKKQKELNQVLGLPSKTESGESFTLRANVEFEEEFNNIPRFNANGIGLLRTESLFINNGSYVDCHSQESFYRKSLKITGNDTVTIRLFDVGGDKITNESQFEANPFLGWRGVRVLLDKKDLLHDQLCAIMKVAGEFPGRVRVLIPMISSLEELLEIQDEITKAREELKSNGLPVDEEMPTGIMVEVPSTAIQADDFAKYVDFFSIGTNDLTQYTLAVDRGNDLISKLYQQMHPSIWRLIRTTAEAAHRNNKGISVCGELASNPFGALCLMGLGINDLSMVPTAIPKVKKELVNHSLNDMKELAEKVEKAVSSTEIKGIMKTWVNSENNN